MMTTPKYIVVSGYHRDKPSQVGYDKFFATWLDNVSKLTPAPEKIIIICDSGARPPLQDCPIGQSYRVTVIPLDGDLGNCHALLNNIKPHHFSGWTGVVLAGALLAYINETDFLFVEEDALCFGQIIWKIYEEIKEAGIIFGTCNWMPCEQSLFLVKHSYIPDFVRLFLNQGRQNTEKNLGEHIFMRLAKEHPTMWYQFSMQFGRNRPIDFNEPVFYAQKWSDDEMNELKRKGFI